jgi:hypothetical protein
MDRGAILLADLRVKLEARRDMLQRATYATVTIEARPAGEFAVRVSWPGDTYEKVFTRAFVFGASMRRAPPLWTVQRRACDHTRDIITEVLQRRGV